MIRQKEILSIISDGIRQIAREQHPDGSFPSLSSPRQDNFSHAFLCSTTFFTSNILSCLAGLGIETSEPASICASAASFILSQKNDQWSWNYWQVGAPEREAMPYPDDLDDTFAALVALVRHDPAMINGKILTATIRLLTTLEIREGGPYRTWLVESKAPPRWRDVDLAVNSTIGYFLSITTGINLPNLERFIDQAVENDTLNSPYYPEVCQLIYFISRFYKGKSREIFCKTLLKYEKENHGTMTTLEQAMTISALINFDFPQSALKENVSELIAIIKKEGWRPYAFCIDPARNGKTFYAGSSAMTAALCIEALSAYLKITPTQYTAKTLFLDKNENAFHERIRSLAKKSCAALPNELSAIALPFLEKTADPKITLLNYRFEKNLAKKLKNKKLAEPLSLANLYGWAAYRIYDDFLDEEGNPKLLSPANFFLRKLAEIYHSLEKDIPGAGKLFEETMNTVDGANAWEQAHCRVPKEKRKYLPEKLPSFGDHKNLADRSFGHALGPLALLLSAGYKKTSREYAATEKFFRHYLIARQLHDDAHDWADDLTRGQINAVGAQVVKDYRGKPSELLADALPRMRHVFWTQTVDGVIQTIQKNIVAARKARANITALKDKAFMEDELARLERAAEKTLQERDRTVEFLREYSAPNVRRQS